ncbi:mCG140716, partial [Mus musculus]
NDSAQEPKEEARNLDTSPWADARSVASRICPSPCKPDSPRPLPLIAGLCKQSFWMDTGHGCASSLNTFHSQTEPQPRLLRKIGRKRHFPCS